MRPTIIKRSQVQLAPIGSGVIVNPTGTGPARPAVKKSAVVVEEAGRPVAIHVTCSCGETTLVELEFPTETAPKPEGKNS